MAHGNGGSRSSFSRLMRRDQQSQDYIFRLDYPPCLIPHFYSVSFSSPCLIFCVIPELPLCSTKHLEGSELRTGSEGARCSRTTHCHLIRCQTKAADLPELHTQQQRNAGGEMFVLKAPSRSHLPRTDEVKHLNRPGSFVQQKLRK